MPISANNKISRRSPRPASFVYDPFNPYFINRNYVLINAMKTGNITDFTQICWDNNFLTFDTGSNIPGGTEQSEIEAFKATHTYEDYLNGIASGETEGFPQLDLRYFSIYDFSFENANFNNMTVNFANFYGGSLTSIDVINTTFNNVIMDGFMFEGTNVKDSKFSQLSYKQIFIDTSTSEAGEATFSTFDQCIFEDNVVTTGDYYSLSVDEATFTSCTFNNFSLENSLFSSTFSDPNKFDVEFDDCIFNQVSFDGSKFMYGASFSGINTPVALSFRNIDGYFNGAFFNLTGPINFENVIFDGATMQFQPEQIPNLNVTDASFIGTIICNAPFSGGQATDEEIPEYFEMNGMNPSMAGSIVVSVSTNVSEMDVDLQQDSSESRTTQAGFFASKQKGEEKGEATHAQEKERQKKQKCEETSNSEDLDDDQEENDKDNKQYRHQ